MLNQRKIVTIIIVVVLIVILWWAVDHLLFPTLPVPAGAPPITK